ncbi:MAG: hypothetical protein N2379_11040 [Verrucomicrobiae bacterium]|nr:hypothetical protein [Verrucomicrobiae bacterium]
MKNVFNAFFLLVVSCVCTGFLLPGPRVLSPGVKGVVVDAETGAPVGGAEVFISYATSWLGRERTNIVTGAVEPVPPFTDQFDAPSMEWALRKARLPIVVTGADGHFSIPPDKRWTIYPEILPRGVLVVRHHSYTPMMLYVHAPPSIVDVGHVRLKPLVR